MDLNEQVLALLGAVVRQNEALVEQNGYFLAFLKERDADVAALNKLHVELATLDLERTKQHYALDERLFQLAGVTREDLGLLELSRKVSKYGDNENLRAAIEIRANFDALAAAQLPPSSAK